MKQQFSTITAIAPANIALIKYWGQRDSTINLPNNSSISFTISNAFSQTSVTFDPQLHQDDVNFNGSKASESFSAKVTKQLNIIRTLVDQTIFAKVSTSNNFPTGAGIASSASGMAALSLAGSKAIGLDLSERELSILARKGSGSASRSIPDGFVKWHKGRGDTTSYAESLYPADYWSIHDLIIVVAHNEKKVSSQAGHKTAATSPLYPCRLKSINTRLNAIEQALKHKDFTLLGETAEAEALNMHAIMMTSNPSLLYWSSETILAIEQVIELRKNGIECYFTIDAGANIHVLVEQANADHTRTIFEKCSFISKVIDAVPTKGARIIRF